MAIMFTAMLILEYKQNCKADILRKKVDFARHQHDRTDKVGLQPWTAVSPFLQPYLIGFCRVGISQSQFFYVVYQPCSFACILVIVLADKVSSRSYVSLQHYYIVCGPLLILRMLILYFLNIF